MQHRRGLGDDTHGLECNLNDTTLDGTGIQVNAKYYMQIFNTKKGQSLQRNQQINIQQPLQYFFIFDFKEA